MLLILVLLYMTYYLDDGWFGKHYLDVWNLTPLCLMWIVWKEWNRNTFEDIERLLDQLLVDSYVV